jgi:phosphate transport system substrate-binding protein
VQDGTYKIARGLYSNTKGEPVGLAKKFIDFLYTPDGKKIIEKHGFIPVRNLLDLGDRHEKMGN